MRIVNNEKSSMYHKIEHESEVQFSELFYRIVGGTVQFIKNSIEGIQIGAADLFDLRGDLRFISVVKFEELIELRLGLKVEEGFGFRVVKSKLLRAAG
jgi:hypothetical protein